MLLVLEFLIDPEESPSKKHVANEFSCSPHIFTLRVGEIGGEKAMATINGLDKMSYAELLKLQERIEAAIAEKRVEDAATTKEALRAMAEKAGFSLKDLFGKRGRRRVLAKPNIAIPKTRRRPGPVAVASRTGSWMP